MSPFAYILFAVSGALGLVYEVVWTRELHLVFGGGAPAAATVLGVFLLGLALGAAGLGRFMARSRLDPWRVYGVLELLVAGLATALPFALTALDPGFRAAYGTALFAPVRFLAVAVLLLPPSMCLGGTLPVMARAIGPDSDGFARRLTRLYAANTGGAALGAFLATFVLLPLLGLRATQWTAAILNVAVGVAAIAWGRRLAGGAPRPAVAAPRAAGTRPRGGGAVVRTPATRSSCRALAPGVAVVLAFASGLAVLLLEVAATRILSITLGQSSYGFGVMLTCFILALALGAWLAGRHAGGSAATSVAVAAASLAGGVAVAVMTWVLDALPWWLAQGQLAIHGSPAPFPLMVGYQFLLAAGAIGLPVAVLGMVFPILLGSVGARATEPSRRVGGLYAANTVGAVVAALAGGFLVLPALGPRSTIVAAGAVATASGLLALALGVGPDPRVRRRIHGLGALAVASLALAWARDVDSLVLARSPWLYARTREEYADYRTEQARQARTVELVAHDAHGTVAVGVHHETDPATRFFSVNGKIDGGTSEEDMRTQVALGTWPCLMFDGGRRDPRHALVIGLGTGVTAGAALAGPLISLDIVDISPSMPAVARRYFEDENRRVLDDPRTRLIVGDGRHHLEYANRTYDVIISEPSNPWISGIGFLYTREGYQAMRAALGDGGVACQWLQLYDLTPRAVASAIGTFASVFPEAMVLTTQDPPSDLLLIGFKSRRPDEMLLDGEALERAFGRRPAPAEYAPYAARGLRDLATHFVLGPQGMAEIGRTAPLNTDDNAFLEFEAPKQLATPGDMTPASDLLGAWREPATEILALPAERRLALADDSRNLALYWRLWSRVHVDAFEIVGRPDSGPRRIPASQARDARAELAEFARRHGPCSLYHHLAGVLAEMRPLPDVRPPTLERYGPGYDPAPARQHFEQGVALAPAALRLKLDLAANYEFGERGDRFGPGAELHKAASLYRQILERAPQLEEVRSRLLAVLARAEPRRTG